MALRPAVTALAAFALAACAVGSSDGAPGLGESGDGGAIGASDGGRGDDGSTLTGPSGPTGATGPGVLDAGPPAVVGGDDAGETDAATAPDTGGALPDGGCSTLAQCPYESATNVAAVACTNGACVITCNGENYDVNGLLADGCEVPATCPVCNGTATCPVDDHSEATATYVGSFPCDDSSSAQDLTGTIPSDDRAHSPAVDGFITLTGSTPGFFNIYGSGGTFCEDDANFTLDDDGADPRDALLHADAHHGQPDADLQHRRQRHVCDHQRLRELHGRVDDLRRGVEDERVRGGDDNGRRDVHDHRPPLTSAKDGPHLELHVVAPLDVLLERYRRSRVAVERLGP